MKAEKYQKPLPTLYKCIFVFFLYRFENGFFGLCNTKYYGSFGILASHFEKEKNIKKSKRVT